MVAKKKSVKKKRAKKKTPTKSHTKEKTVIREKLVYPKASNTEKVLIENFVSLQKVMVNLSTKFDDLTKQISNLLKLFEVSAKSLAEKDVDLEKSSKDTKSILEKMDNMFDQNKTIAKGLTLIHDRIEDQGNHGSLIYEPQQPIPPKAMPKAPPLPRKIPKPVVEQGSPRGPEYKKSISSKSPSFP